MHLLSFLQDILRYKRKKLNYASVDFEEVFGRILQDLTSLELLEVPVEPFLIVGPFG